jgi:alkylation response protein AidB-like acyl-CoA dehydrogenase
LVDYPNPGVSIGQEFESIGPGYLRRSCDYVYSDCVVPAENMLGARGQGFGHMMEQLNRNRCVIAARLVGAAGWAQRKAIAYAKERSTFGEPLAGRQAIQWMLAESDMDIEQVRLLTYKAAWMVDKGIDARKEVAMVKCLAPVVSARVIDRAMQIHGGIGLVKETRLAQLYGHARVAQVAEGSTEMMKLTVAREVLRQSPADA